MLQCSLAEVGELFDLAIIGGGINGAALAALAAQNGYRTVLLEKNDFGSGVTSRSTRLIHGGLRYLEHGQVRVVRESLRERESLLAEFPHQVRPLPFLVPVYGHDSRHPWWIGLGLEAYSWIGHSRRIPRHQRLSVQSTIAAEPGIERRDLRAGFLYYDCQAVYPERLALEMALTAERDGAEVWNHAAVTGFLVERGAMPRVVGVQVADGSEYRARMVVNAAGPWVDEVRRMLPQSAGGPVAPLLTLISGTHIVTAGFAGAPSHAVYHEATVDRRPFFVVPWRGLWLIGTTEIPYDGDPGKPAPSAAEIDYLLRETNLLFPGAGLQRSSILYAYAGARPLLRGDAGRAESISRDHAIYDHEEHDGITGMLTLAGGKLTTARAFADEVLGLIARKLGRPQPSRRPLASCDLDGVPVRLAEIYGRRAGEVMALAGRQPELHRPVCPPNETAASEVVYCITHEKAQTLADILLRRTGLGFEPALNQQCVTAVARLAAPLLGWDDGGINRAVSSYYEEANQTLHQQDLHRQGIPQEGLHPTISSPEPAHGGPAS